MGNYDRSASIGGSMAEIELELENRVGPGFQPDSSTIHLNDREDRKLIRKTSAQTPAITPDVPSPSDPSLVGRAKPVSNTLRNIHEALETYKGELEEIAENNTLPSHFPFLAWEAVKAGLAKEKITNDQIQGHIREAERMQKQIDLLLDLSAELTAYKEGKPIPEKMTQLLEQLKEEHDIDLWKGGDFTKEKISELKSLTSSKVDALRSNLQILFTTKIQVLIQQVGSIMEILKDIIRQNSRLVNKTLTLPGH